jgi:3-hydroxymyristoyl/3-hydroxydecanoyl-(acyl carrier protein) dehydratase
MINLDIPHEHASFPGHFPANPILPGVLLLERVMSYVQSQMTNPLQKYTLLNVKFLAAVSPGDQLSLVLSDSNSNEKHFSIHILRNAKNDSILACTGKLRFNEAQ